MASTTAQAEGVSQQRPSDNNVPTSAHQGENISSSEGNDLSQPHEKFTSIELSNSESSSSEPTVTAPRQMAPTPSADVGSHVSSHPPQQQMPPPQYHSSPGVQPPQPLQHPSQLPSHQQQPRPPMSANVLPTAPGGVQIGRNGNNFNFKQWSTTNYRYAKQIINERIGRGTRTFDAQLEGQIQGLRDTQFKYSSLLRLIKQYIIQFRAVLITQAALGDSFADLAIRSVDLESEFSSNAKTQVRYINKVIVNSDLMPSYVFMLKVIMINLTADYIFTLNCPLVEFKTYLYVFRLYAMTVIRRKW